MNGFRIDAQRSKAEGVTSPLALLILMVVANGCGGVTVQPADGDADGDADVEADVDADVLADGDIDSGVACARDLDRPTPIDGHSMAFDSRRGVAVLFGGRACDQPQGETWEWDGSAWTDVTPSGGPEPRFEHGMAYDSHREVVVLVGGLASWGGESFGDTWEWDGTTWAEAVPFPGELPGSARDLVYDSARRAALLFVLSGPSEGVWQFDGDQWTLAGPTMSDGPSSGGTDRVVFDSVRNVVVLGSGYSSCTYGASGSTFEWDGTWREPDTPFLDGWGAVDFVFAFDSGVGLTLAHGGYRCMGDSPIVEEILCDTWSWDGESWSEWSFPDGPRAGSPPCRGGVMVYDSSRSEMVVVSDRTYVMRADGWHVVDR